MPESFALDDDSDIDVAAEENFQCPKRQPEFFQFDDASYDVTAQELLTNAARLGDVDEVKALLQTRGRQPLGKLGDVPLSEAVRAGHVTVVAMLLLGMADAGSAISAALEAPSTPAAMLVLLASKADPEDEKARRQRMVFSALDECMKFLVGWLLRKLGVNLAVKNVLSDTEWDAACDAEMRTARISHTDQAGQAAPQEVAQDQPSRRSAASEESLGGTTSARLPQPDATHESNWRNDTLDDARDPMPKPSHQDDGWPSERLREDIAQSKSAASRDPATGSTGMPCGPEACYEVLHSPRMPVRGAPTMDGDILTAVLHGSKVRGIPHEVKGTPWLKLSSETCRECQLATHLDAWLLIDGRSQNLSVLLGRLGTSGDIEVVLPSGRTRKPTGWARAALASSSSAVSAPQVSYSSKSSSSSSTIYSGLKPWPKAAGAAPLAAPLSSGTKPISAHGPTDVKPVDSDGQYEVLQPRLAVRDAPLLTGGIINVAKQGLKLCGTPYLIDGSQWLRLDTKSTSQLGLDEDGEEGAWVLIDGTILGVGIVMKRVADGLTSKDDECKLDGNEEWIKQWREWYAVEVAKPKNSHLPVDKLEAYSKQLDEAICSNNRMLVKSLLQTRGQLCRAHGAFDLACKDLELAATIYHEDAAVRFACGIARLEAGGRDSASKALSDFRVAQSYNLDPKYASSKVLDSWIQRAKHWNLTLDKPTHYHTLGVQIDATPEQLKKAYKSAVKCCHPDKGGDSERFCQVHQAYQVLSTPQSRRAYDFGEGQAVSQPRGKARPKSKSRSASKS